MFRPLLLTATLATVTAVAVPTLPAALAEDPAPAGRYLLSSDNNAGFVRLDTKTGAISHCGQSAGSWYCEPLAEGGIGPELAALSDRVTELASGLDRLSARVDGLAADVAKAVEPPALPAAEDVAAEPGFTGRVLARFLDMVRSLKYAGNAEG